MTIYDIAKYLLIISSSSIIILLSILVYYIKRGQKHGQQLILRHTVHPTNDLYVKLFKYLSRFYLTKGYMKKIRTRIEIVHNYSDLQLRKLTVKIFSSIAGVISSLILTFINLTNNWYLIFLFIITLYFLADTVLDYFVERIKNKIMYQQMAFNDEVRHKYYELKMVDEAIYEASQNLPKSHYEIGVQGIRMYDVLMSKELEKEMIVYNETAPNKYLKMLLGLAYMTKEYGDTELENGASLFMKSINYLNNEIRMEVMKRQRLNYALKSLSIIALLPLFCLEPLKQWAGYNFMPLQVFYESQVGYILQITMVTLVILCFFGIRKIQKMEDNKVYLGSKKLLSQRLYERGLYQWIDHFVPKEHTKKYQHTKQNLTEVLSPHTLGSFYTKKLLMASGLLVTSLMMVFSIKAMTKENVLSKPTLPTSFVGGRLSEEKYEEAMAMTKEDTMAIEKLGVYAGEEKIKAYLEEQGVEDEAVLVYQINRIYYKMQMLQNQYIKWWEVLICLFLCCIGYLGPDLMIWLQKRMIKIDMEDEVSQFQTILLILMHIKHISVYEILEWLELFSVSFRDPLAKCLNNYEAGAVEALEQLTLEATYAPFVHIINNLKIAVEDLSVEEAFDELESEKEYYQELRKMTNEKIIQRKQWIGQVVGFTPLYGLIGLYLMIPMIIVSIADLDKYYQQIINL